MASKSVFNNIPKGVETSGIALFDDGSILVKGARKLSIEELRKVCDWAHTLLITAE